MLLKVGDKVRNIGTGSCYYEQVGVVIEEIGWCVSVIYPNGKVGCHPEEILVKYIPNILPEELFTI